MEFGNSFVREGFASRAKVSDPMRRTLKLTKSDHPFGKLFFVWNIEGSTVVRNLLLLAILLAVVAGVMQPFWPREVHVGVRYVTLTAALGLLGFTVFRFVLFFVLYAFGVDCWIFPNLWSDTAGFRDSFKPLYSFHVSGAKEPSRIVAIGILLWIGYLVATHSTDYDEYIASHRTFVEDLYAGTLLSDTSQTSKELIDVITLEKEIEELEKQL